VLGFIDTAGSVQRVVPPQVGKKGGHGICRALRLRQFSHSGKRSVRRDEHGQLSAYLIEQFFLRWEKKRSWNMALGVCCDSLAAGDNLFDVEIIRDA
jgi:hypothetical protein